MREMASFEEAGVSHNSSAS